MNRAPWCSLLLGAGLVALCGCGRNAADTGAAVPQQVFDNSVPELKQVWDRALEADRTNDFVGAQTLLYALTRSRLTPSQDQAVRGEMATVSKRMSDLAEKGDPAALKALEELRRNPPNRRR